MPYLNLLVSYTMDLQRRCMQIVTINGQPHVPSTNAIWIIVGGRWIANTHPPAGPTAIANRHQPLELSNPVPGPIPRATSQSSSPWPGRSDASRGR